MNRTPEAECQGGSALPVGRGDAGVPPHPVMGTARTRALLWQPCPCSCCCEIYQWLPRALLPPCLPPTPNPIRNLLLGTAPVCAEGSLTRRITGDRQGCKTQHRAQPCPACPAWVLGVLPVPGAAPGVLGQMAHPQNPALVLVFWTWGGGLEGRGASCEGKQHGLTLWGSALSLFSCIL